MATAITSGAELVRKLKESGTGEAKLAVAREVLRADRSATAAEVVAALAERFPGNLTVDKARSFAETGEWNPESERVVVAIEDEILSGGEPGTPAAKESKPAAEAEKAARTTGPGVDRPGVGPVQKEDVRPTAGRK